MNPGGNDGLSQDERAALGDLPMERHTSQLLEERVVSTLKKRGLLGAPALRTHHGLRFAVAAAVASLLFVSGVVVGQWTGSRAVADSFANAHQQTVLEAAAQIQRSGSAYVSALTAFAEVASSSEDPDFAQGREVALAALYAAAHQLAMIAPEDPVAIMLRARLDHIEQEYLDTEEPAVRRVVWF